MDNVRFGITVRTVRIRRGWRQDDLAAVTHVSRAQIGRIEHGHLDSIQLGRLRNVCAALEIRVDLMPRWRGADLDRMISSRHALLAESVVEALRRDSPEWQVFPEVSFSIWGERGVIDLLAWHPSRRALLVIELKTELVDRKQRLAAQVAAERGWDADTVSGWIVLAAGRTNERHLAAFRSTLRAAYPADARQMRAWLKDPIGSIAALSMWHEVSAGSSRTARTSLAATQRVRRRSSAVRPARGTPPKPNAAER